ncbi:MAG: putative hydro-lyase [Gemmataceae bacterium]|nr:putative hydro-lyase [Gemmataceae bacterium]
MTPKEIRSLCRTGKFTSPTPGLAPGFVQANLVIVPEAQAFDFLLFCQRNSKPCPLIEVLEKGKWEPVHCAPGADLRTDLPRYRVFDSGKLVAEVDSIGHLWQPDLVSFLIGCSFTFDAALTAQGLPVRHEQEKKNVPMYKTLIPCAPAGVFHGPLVVSMRPMLPGQALEAARVTGRFPRAHGGPVHLGNPAAIGIHDLASPDFGDPVTIHEGEVPVFWACGVTPQAAAVESKIPLLITHSPGHMFVTDWQDSQLEGETKV